MVNEFPYRTLGKTGENVSIIGIGGSHISNPEDPKVAINLIRAAIDRGINFMDNSWDYHHGESERRMGEALKGGYRDKAFLMTKVDGRTKASAKAQLDQSLKRLQVDYVDLLQLHEVIRWDDPDRAFAPGGAMEGFDEAKAAGKIRYIGFTGHKDPGMHLKMLEYDYPWDTVQLPINVLDAHYNSFIQKVLPVLIERNIGVLAMKPLAGGFLFDSGTVSAIEAFHYVMNLPVGVVITGMESFDDLNQAIEAAVTFRPLSEDEVAEILGKSAPKALAGEFERYKTDRIFDATSTHPEWLESA